MKVCSIVAGVTATLATLLVVPTAGAPTADAAAQPALRPDAGPGWYLAQIDRGKRGPFGIEARRQRLVLVSPDGDRHRVLDRSVRRGTFRLVDWSPDGGTALLLSQGDGRPRTLRVDVPSGATQPTVLPRNVASAVLAPDGSGILAVGYERERTGKAPLFAVAWDGRRAPVAADVDGPVLPSADGASLVTNGPGSRSKTMRVLSAADGTVQKRIGTTGHCLPVRWWSARRVLAQCSARTGASRLALVDTASGSVSALTRRHPHQRGDLGHLDARRIDSGVYVQVAGPCGYIYLGRKAHDGSVGKVPVPHAVGNVRLLDGSGRWLVVEHAISCDGSAPRSALARFDPVTKKERELVVLPRHEAFGAILRYGERQPTGL